MSKRELPQVIIDLRAIRNRLSSPEAWSKSLFGNEEGPNCLVGAMDVIIERDYNFDSRDRKVEAGQHMSEAHERRTKAKIALSRALPRGYTNNSVTRYNDALTTTHENILTLIDRALESEKMNLT